MARREQPRPTPFSEFIRKRRIALGISLLELERRTSYHSSRLSRWERGLDQPDHPARLAALAKGLEVPLADMYAQAGVEPTSELPTLRPYLRTKYGRELPPRALERIAKASEQIAAEYGVVTGPRLGEDEKPPKPGTMPSQEEVDALF